MPATQETRKHGSLQTAMRSDGHMMSGMPKMAKHKQKPKRKGKKLQQAMLEHV